ncbi:MAG: hypothetical protein IR527_02155 [Bacteroides sp.]|nr:MAG: hypothetical protein IR527_02155 [Bacteroides sp.]
MIFFYKNIIFFFCIIILIEYKDPLIDQIINDRIILNTNYKTKKGYRILLYYGSDINKYLKYKKLYIEKYNNNIYFQYIDSNFILTTGDYEYYSEAYHDIEEMSSIFNDIMIVDSEINS